MKSNQRVARIVGALFIAGMVVGITGNLLIQTIFGVPDYLSAISENSIKLAASALLLMLTVGGDAAHGILMFPLLRKHNEHLAIGYLSFRIIDAVFLGIQILFILVQIPLGSQYLKAAAPDAQYLSNLGTLLIQANLFAYEIGMIFVGLAGLILTYMFFKIKLVPRFLAVWGLVGYATILCGSLLVVLGFDMQFIHTLPGGLWELFIGGWLIVKGFNTTPSASVTE